MEKITKKLIIAFLIITLTKIALSLLVTTPTIFTDEYIYMKMAQSFFQNLNFNIHNIPTSNYPALYPIILSITYIFNNPTLSYILMKILNSIISSTIMIPSFLLAKEFIDKNKAIIPAILVGLLPMNFAFSPYIMSENLFYPLFMFSIYFIYKSFIKKGIKYDITAGILIGLTFLTKFAGISLVIITIALLVYKIYKKEHYEVHKKLIMGLVSLIVVSPWLIRNIALFGPSLKGIIGQYSSEVTKEVSYYFRSLIFWLIIYTSHIFLALWIIFPGLAFLNLKNKIKTYKNKIFVILIILTTMFILLGAAQHAAKSSIKEKTLIPNINGRPIGRYVDTALPILLIAALVTYYKYNLKGLSKFTLISIIPIIIGSQLFYFQLLPANNISLTLFGIMKNILTKITNQHLGIIITTSLLIIGCIISYTLLQKKDIKKLKIIPILAIILILTSLASYSITIYSSKTYWENNPQIKLSKWLNKNIPKNEPILIDEEFCGVLNKENQGVLCTRGRSTTLIGVWITNPVFIKKINEPNYKYIITKRKLDLKLIQQTENNIYLYKKE